MREPQNLNSTDNEKFLHNLQNVVQWTPLNTSTSASPEYFLTLTFGGDLLHKISHNQTSHDFISSS